MKPPAFAFASAVLLAACASSAEPRAAEAAQAVTVVMTTDLGDIRLELYPDAAPGTVANFLAYVDQGLYAGAAFYRSVTPGTDPRGAGMSLIQGGIAGEAFRTGVDDPASPLPPIAHEPTTLTGLSHVDGVISMGRIEPGTAASEFFITIGDANVQLDAGPGTRNADGFGYAAFGRVTFGMDVARAIQAGETTAQAPSEVFAGQVLKEPLAIVSVRRVGKETP